MITKLNINGKLARQDPQTQHNKNATDSKFVLTSTDGEVSVSLLWQKFQQPAEGKQ